MIPDSDCDHYSITGDNYKETCNICGKVEWHE